MSPEPRCENHVPELRERRSYDQTVILGDAWVCARCEKFLRWAAAVEATQ